MTIKPEKKTSPSHRKRRKDVIVGIGASAGGDAKDELPGSVTEDALRKSESILRGILDASQESIWLFSAEGFIITGNPTALRRLGKPLEEIAGKPFTEIIPPELAQSRMQRLKQTIESKAPVEFEDERAGIFFRHSFYPVIDDTGNVSSIACFSRDITERKRAEEQKRQLTALVQQERDRLSLIINNLPIEVWYSDTDKNFTLANPAALEEFGLTDAFNQIGIEKLASDLEVYRPDLTIRSIDEAPPLRALRGEIVRNQEEIVRTPATGELRYRLVSASPIRDNHGNITGSVTVVQDITDRKQAEVALRESEERFKAIAETAPLGIGVVAASDATFLYVNPAYEKAFGYSTDELLGKKAPDIWWDQAERDKIINLLKKTGAVVDFEVRLKRKDGSQFWGLASNKRITYGGKPATLGVFVDISGRKKMENDLRETKDYLDKLFQYANAPIIVWDPDMRITRFNGGFEQMTGYKAEEVLGGHLSRLFPSNSRKTSLENIMRALGGEHWEWAEIPILRKDGIVRLALWNSANVYGEDGTTLLATIAQGTDITDRRKNELEIFQRTQELQIKNEELERFNRISVDRELRMIELKKQVNDLCAQTGAPPKYNLDFDKGNA
jgi:PAS domain S-box-containing protein